MNRKELDDFYKKVEKMVNEDFVEFNRRYIKTGVDPVIDKPKAQKFDDDKLRVDLVPKSLIEGTAKAMMFGMRKYSAHNWRKGLQWSRSYGALQRHLQAFWEGEDFDQESDLNHLYHAACNLAFLIEFYEKRKDLDDRYKPEVKDIF